MHDVNIEDMTKLSVLALPFFSSIDIKPNKSGDIMMHDINIEEIIKAKLSVLALSLFFNTSTNIYFQFERIGHILKSSMLRQ